MFINKVCSIGRLVVTAPRFFVLAPERRRKFAGLHFLGEAVTSRQIRTICHGSIELSWLDNELLERATEPGMKYILLAHGS